MNKKNKFYIYKGDTIGLPKNENYLVFRWARPGCKVLFSTCQVKDAAMIHIASDRRGLRHLESALKDFVGFLGAFFPWCRKVGAKIDRPSMRRLAEKCGFKKAVATRKYDFYMRCVSWA